MVVAGGATMEVVVAVVLVFIMAVSCVFVGYCLYYFNVVNVKIEVLV